MEELLREVEGRVTKINIDKLISIAHINDKIAEEYKRVFSTIKTPEKPKIIT